MNDENYQTLLLEPMVACETAGEACVPASASAVADLPEDLLGDPVGAEDLAELRALENPIGASIESVRELVGRLPEGSALHRRAAALLSSMEAAAGPLALDVMLGRQPSARDLTFVRRTDALAATAARRMHKSKYMFPAPSLFLARVAAATADWTEEDRREVAHRAAHALAHLHLPTHGFELSVVLRRAVTASPAELETALRAFLEASDRGGR